MSDPTPQPDPSAMAQSGSVFLPMVYDELRRLAQSRLGQWGDMRTMQATALVHEAWLRMSGQRDGMWESRDHFIGVAAHAMRQVLIGEARRKSAAKRQVDLVVDSSIFEVAAPEKPDHILLIHEALERLEKSHPAAARIVELRFFGCLGASDIARVEGCSLRSVERQWAFAKVRLYQIIRDELSSSSSGADR